MVPWVERLALVSSLPMILTLRSNGLRRGEHLSAVRARRGFCGGASLQHCWTCDRRTLKVPRTQHDD